MAKKISAIVSLSLVGILLVATIIMANVKVDYSINCQAPHSIDVLYGSNQTAKTTTPAQAKEIQKLIGNASKEMSLSALFTGRLNKKAEITSVESNGITLPTTQSFYVFYEYDTPQVLMYGNKAYKTNEDKNFYYQTLVFAVEDTEEATNVKVYVKQYYNSNNPAEGKYTENKYNKYYVLEANFASLYQYLLDNNFNN